MNVWQIVCAVGLTMLCLAPLGVRAGEPLQRSPPHSQVQAQNHAPRADGSPVAVPEPSAKALRHYHESLVLSGARILWMLLAPALFVFTGCSARVRSWAERLGRRWYFTFALYAVACGLIYFSGSLPLSYYAGFVHPHQYDLSNQTFGRWLDHYVKDALVVMLGVLAIGWFPFLVIRKSPRRCALWCGRNR